MDTLIRAALSNAVSATLLALLVVGLGRALGRRPALMHCLWLLVLLKLVTPPLYQLPVPRLGLPNSGDFLDANGQILRFVVEGSNEGTASSTTARNVRFDAVLDANEPPTSPQRKMLNAVVAEIRVYGPPVALVIWITGTVTTLFVTGRRVRRFQSLLNEAKPVPDPIQDWVEELAGRLGLTNPPQAYWVSGRLSPMLWALGRRPRLIIPTELWKKLDEHQRLTLIVHELAHLCRGDHHVRLFEFVVTALYWWHPVLWWSRKALHNVEEQCCDAWVVWTLPDSARCYAETLLEAIDFLHQTDRPEPLLASGFGKAHHLRRRLTMIMTGTTPRLRGAWGTLGSIGLAAVLLPINPTWAQKADADPEAIQVLVDEIDTHAKAGEPVKESDAKDRTIPDEDKKREIERTVASIEELEKVRADLNAKIEALQKKLKQTGSDPAIHALELRSNKLLNKLILLRSSVASAKPSTATTTTTTDVTFVATPKSTKTTTTADVTFVVNPKAEKATTTADVTFVVNPKAEKPVVGTLTPRTVTFEGVRAHVAPIEKQLAVTFVNPLHITTRGPAVAVEDARVGQPAKAPIVVVEGMPAAQAVKPQKVVVEEVRIAEAPKSPLVIGVETAKAHAITIQGSAIQLSDKDRIAQLEKRLEALLNEVATLKKEQKGESRPNGGLGQ
ncbi:M56 family metallopeptidase [Singulisphaera rosea]